MPATSRRRRRSAGVVQFYTDFSLGTTGEPIADLQKLRTDGSGGEWGYNLVTRADGTATGGKIAKLEGTGGGSRPHSWLAVPYDNQQEMLSKFRVSSYGDAGGAVVCASIKADGLTQNEYGSRLCNDGAGGPAWHFYQYTDGVLGGSGLVPITMLEWPLNTWMNVLTRMTPTEVLGKFWIAGNPEPMTGGPNNDGWRSRVNRIATIDAQKGTVGPYCNTVATGVEFDILSAAIGGAKAALTGSPVVPVLPTVDLTNGIYVGQFGGEIGNTLPVNWAKSYGTDCTWPVANIGAPEGGAIASVSSSSNPHFLVYNPMSTSQDVQEILLKIRHPAGALPTFGNGVVLRCPNLSNPSSGYAIYLSNTGIDACMFNTGYTNLQQNSAKFSGITGNVWYWLRVRVAGTAIRARVWKLTEPEPAHWMLTQTHATLTGGRIGLYHYNADTTHFDDIVLKTA